MNSEVQLALVFNSTALKRDVCTRRNRGVFDKRRRTRRERTLGANVWFVEYQGYFDVNRHRFTSIDRGYVGNPTRTRASVLLIRGAHAVGDMWPPFKTKPFKSSLDRDESFILGRCGENENQHERDVFGLSTLATKPDGFQEVVFPCSVTVQVE